MFSHMRGCCLRCKAQHAFKYLSSREIIRGITSPVTDLPLICNFAQVVLVSKEGESYSQEERASIARSIVKGLAFLHREQIFLENNLVPENILIPGEKYGIQSIFRSEIMRKCNDSSAATREDLRYLSHLLAFVWSRSEEGKIEDMNYNQHILVSKLKQELSEIQSMDQVVQEVAFWSPRKTMDFPRFGE